MTTQRTPDPAAVDIGKFQQQLQGGQTGPAAELQMILNKQLDVLNQSLYDTQPGAGGAFGAPQITPQQDQTIEQNPGTWGAKTGLGSPITTGQPAAPAAPAAAAGANPNRALDPTGILSGANRGTAPGQVGMLPEDLIKTFENSDPTLVFGSVINHLRTSGTNNNLVNWVSRNFERFWSEYKGIAVDQVRQGQIPLTFPEYIGSSNIMNQYFADSSQNRQSQRFADVASGGNR